MKLADHPTVRARKKLLPVAPSTLDLATLRRLALDAGADDVGVVLLERPEVADQRAEILTLLPGARTLVAFVVRMNPDPIRSPPRSVANLEFHDRTDHTNEVALAIARKLAALGHRATTAAAGFPMEMNRFPGKSWVISHKPIAVAAGLGVMGIHRNVIHPRFGNFVLLGTVVTDAVVKSETTPLDFNPCLECKLCVAACPVGAIAPDGRFAFDACYTHNYREFMGGFTDWVETVADATDAADYRSRVTDSESASMWQSLSFGANYKAAYCMAVCPAGDDVIGPFLASRQGWLEQVVRPLQDKEEPVYVVAGSDAEAHVTKRFPHKRVRRVKNGLRVRSVLALPRALPIAFQPGASKGTNARYHFLFRGRESLDLTVVIEDGTITTEVGLHGDPDLVVTADAETWVRFLLKERSILWALLTRRVRLKGPLALLQAFGRCFP